MKRKYKRRNNIQLVYMYSDVAKRLIFLFCNKERWYRYTTVMIEHRKTSISGSLDPKISIHEDRAPKTWTELWFVGGKVPPTHQKLDLEYAKRFDKKAFAMLLEAKLRCHFKYRATSDYMIDFIKNSILLHTGMHQDEEK